MRVGLDEFPNSEAICSFLGGNANVLAHDFPFLFNLLRRGKKSVEKGPRFEECPYLERSKFATDARVLESTRSIS
jgi:hypothetical protein